MGVGEATQSVGSVGASTGIVQNNLNGDFQVNVTARTGAVNTGNVSSVGNQVNVGVVSATNRVTAVGASAGTFQRNDID